MYKNVHTYVFLHKHMLCFLLSAVSMTTMYQFGFDLSLHCDVLLALRNIVSDRWCVVLNCWCLTKYNILNTNLAMRV